MAASGYHTILLDLDHTLLDSDASLRLALESTLSTAGVHEPGSHHAAFDAINRPLWKAVERGEVTPPQAHLIRFQRLVSALEVDADPAALADQYAADLGLKGELYPGARDALEAMAEHATLALLTNGLSDIQRTRIARLEIGGYFDAVVISAEVGVAKPAVEIFHLCFEALGSPDRNSSIMVGDSLSSDIAGGAAYGIDTCWYNPEGARAPSDLTPTHAVADLAELAELVLP